jgi:hypothetical protein
VDRDEDVEAIVSSSSGIQQSPDGNLIHQLGHRAATDIIAAQRTQSPLDRSVALYKPGQMMLLDHCKLTLLFPSGMMIGACSGCFED